MAKPLGKRAAFGDLSNTTALKSKDENKTQDKVAAGLARPTQRPAAKSVSSAASPLDVGIKSLLGQGNTRKPLARRNTVFRDPALPSVAESASKDEVKDYHEAVDTKPVTEGTVNGDKPAASVKNEASREDDTPEVGPAVPHGTVKSEQEIEEHVEKLHDMQLATASAAAGGLVDLTSGAVYDLPSELCDRVDLTENVEESWDEYDDNEDDEYITSLNLPLMDNTTGPATVVLFPKYDRDAKQELAIAKKVVDIKGTTRDEYEDEQFDTSMVAEYGTEIFQYMRELEVCYSTSSCRVLLTCHSAA